MKKIFVLFILFVVSVSAILLTDIPYLPTTGKVVLIMAIAITFEIFLMDTSFFKRKTRSALRKNIDDHPYNK
ncbi:MAG: hypothetical protein WDO19_26605 [Bacteroidota bacterium]